MSVVSDVAGDGVDDDQGSRRVHHDDGRERREDQRGAAVCQQAAGGEPLRGRQGEAEGGRHRAAVSGGTV